MATTVVDLSESRGVVAAAAARRPAAWPWAVLGAAVAAAALALVPATSASDRSMAGLVRAFALLKVALLVGFHALLVWRVRHPVAPATVARYGVVLAVMALGPVLGWRGTAIPLAFVCFDGGLLALLVIALTDDARPRRAHTG